MLYIFKSLQKYTLNSRGGGYTWGFGWSEGWILNASQPSPQQYVRGVNF